MAGTRNDSEEYHNGFLLASHGPLAPGALRSAELIVGELAPEQVSVLQLDPGNDLQLFEKQMRTTVEQLLVHNDHVIIVTDLLGGTPNNVASKIFLTNQQVELVTGLNLGLLLELFAKKDTRIVLDAVVAAAQKAIRNMNELRQTDKQEAEGWL
ncbi:PTS sugar transporter subunit IIA [Lacticaseibacillus zhaodongensis]|uniref:PTS sugar transporter subunit IIA n=1 Tax=Lacticaseibacillus zhaodongensis TaxID=2668065 RepID=UPI0012D31CAA|nr:PTS mannose transporter subunit IIA [Lacticaseibacillus zhaodongensis]